jgi:hypothetical protein
VARSAGFRVRRVKTLTPHGRNALTEGHERPSSRAAIRLARHRDFTFETRQIRRMLAVCSMRDAPPGSGLSLGSLMRKQL